MEVDLDGAGEPEAPTDLLVGDTLSEHQHYLALPLEQILINRHPDAKPMALEAEVPVSPGVIPVGT
jgi:hypothetical protein